MKRALAPSFREPCTHGICVAAFLRVTSCEGDTVLRYLHLYLALALIAALLSLPRSAEATTVFSADFQTSVPTEFSSGSLSASNLGSEALNQGLSQYLGSFTLGQSTTLTLTGLAAHTDLQLEFDLYLFRTWDGSSSFGPDFFSLSGDISFSKTFTNHHGTALNPNQTYDSLGDVFLNSTGSALSAFGDPSSTQAFFDLGPNGALGSFDIAHSATSFSVTFGGPTTQDDEQWAIDNVRVSIVPIPEPSAALLVATGLIVLSASRHRRGH
jgi:hypothetical protein